MKRYNVVSNDNYDMEEATDGMWVMYNDIPKLFIRERAQLEQEWCELRQLQAQYNPAPVAPAEPASEPVAVSINGHEGIPDTDPLWLEEDASIKNNGRFKCYGLWPLSAAPQPSPARGPLTDAEIDRLSQGNNYPGTVPGARRFARAIEAAHGIPRQRSEK